VANLVIELVLIYGFGTGIGGSAAATVVAQGGAAVAYGFFILRAVRRTGVGLRPDRRRLRALLTMGRDLFIRTGALLLALAAATAVAARIGTASVAAHQIAFQLWSFLALVLDAVAIAGQAMIGRLLGGGQPEEARAAGRRMIEWGVLAGVALGAAVVASRPFLIPLFTGDDDVARLAGGVLLLVAVMQPLNAVVFVLDGVLIGAGDLRYLAVAMVAASFGVFVPAAVVVERAGLSLNALWGALILLMLARTVGNVVRFASPTWQVTGNLRQ
jgi:putative MATE family efflux protein